MLFSLIVGGVKGLIAILEALKVLLPGVDLWHYTYEGREAVGCLWGAKEVLRALLEARKLKPDESDWMANEMTSAYRFSPRCTSPFFAWLVPHSFFTLIELLRDFTTYETSQTHKKIADLIIALIGETDGEEFQQVEFVSDYWQKALVHLKAFVAQDLSVFAPLTVTAANPTTTVNNYRNAAAAVIPLDHYETCWKSQYNDWCVSKGYPQKYEDEE